MTPELASIIIGIVIVISALISIPLAKKFNPKSLLIFSAVGISACLFAFGSFCYFKETSVMSGLPWLPLVNFIVYVGFFMVSAALLLEKCNLIFQGGEKIGLSQGAKTPKRTPGFPKYKR